MAMQSHMLKLFILCLSIALVPCSSQLQTSQAWSLLGIQHLLNYPSALSSWNNFSDICDAEQNPFFTVVCYEESITQLHIIGNESTPPLPKNFSIHSFFTTLTRLPDLKVLSLRSLGLWGHIPAKISRLSSLEIVNMSSNYFSGVIPSEVSYLKNLQTLILDHNMFSGHLPDWIGSLPLLTVLSVKNNNLSGTLPDSISKLESLRVLVLSSNSFSGKVPDLSLLTNLQMLDLGENHFVSQFPNVGKELVYLKLRKNKFTGSLPSEITSCYLLQWLDVSSNRFVGPFPPSLLSLPYINYLNISGNRFTGMLFQNMSCSDTLESADLSANLLTGSMPSCLVSNSNNKIVIYYENCLTTKSQNQHPSSFCQTQALAVGIVPRMQKKIAVLKAIRLVCVIGGVIVGSLLVGILILAAIKRLNSSRASEQPPRRLIEHASHNFPSKLLTDARYISQTMKLGTLGLPSYRSFSLEELEAATNNFETSAFMGEGSYGQMYKGRLNDGSMVAIRCLKLKKGQNYQNFNRHIELISKLRHRHLVSALGHCFEYYLDDSTVSRLFLIFEYMPNGTLRTGISEGVGGQMLTWSQRISSAIGVARGIQFLHAGIIPGLFGNNLKITNILSRSELLRKISSYNLPVLSESVRTDVKAGSVGSSNGPKDGRTKHMDKKDVYDFGVILLELISGRPMKSQHETNIIKDELQASISTDGESKRKSNVDPVVRRACCDESLKTVMEICVRCLSREPTERPSVEDVLWNLQFAAQVQDAWRKDSSSSEGSPFPSYQPRRSLA
ncbi:LOW QUALITY PROTEIN: probable inactive leucine-rich repeat receptor-like protein kinase At3g03770 [Dioscorea cayenensis subsp. rotundata]|uniref:LOW QUALITY PROTEIN: probable inactive leucine-rich repeat receptor-like protein kinase At3g03770 n=1 Tax=Dioscorea cayennensis subsp. rotundata TaxID=55577 RepID=A0AB40CL79_DIOCR|nr:LOW QUALITY PROTEIN: probable inactive leucine-rich repeat receptor-like protein kinase At3g03770 [Dioscorea cayenensis subsp. rotundata]